MVARPFEPAETLKLSVKTALEPLSTLTVFGPEIHRHARGQCSATSHTPFLPLPSGMPTHEEDWT